MFKRSIFLLICTLGVMQPCFSNSTATRLQYGRDWTYQTMLVNGEIIYSSGNSSGGTQVIFDRYEAIKTILKKYKRPFTVLDLGANNGFFSLKIAEDFDAVSVMVEGTERLTEICILNTERNKIIHLQKHFTQHDIQELCQREHFDVILALHVLHHVDNWHSWFHTLLKMGDNLIIETPPVNDPINSFSHTKQLAQYVTSLKNGVQIGAFHRMNGIYDHMIWFCQNEASFINPPSKLGISPSTFFHFNGRFPSKSYVSEMNYRIQTNYGNRPWVLQGVDYYLE